MPSAELSECSPFCGGGDVRVKTMTSNFRSKSEGMYATRRPETSCSLRNACDPALWFVVSARRGCKKTVIWHMHVVILCMQGHGR